MIMPTGSGVHGALPVHADEFTLPMPMPVCHDMTRVQCLVTVAAAIAAPPLGVHCGLVLWSLAHRARSVSIVMPVEDPMVLVLCPVEEGAVLVTIIMARGVLRSIVHAQMISPTPVV